MKSRSRRSPRHVVLLWTLVGCSPDLSGLSSRTSAPEANDGGSAPGALAGGGPAVAASGAGSTGTMGGTGDVAVGGSSAGGTAAPEGAAGRSTPPCVPRDEVCDDHDDDCDGIVDNGCPSGVSTVYDRDLEILGDSPGGAAFSDDCRDDEVLSGVRAAAGAFVSQIQGICRPLSLTRSANEHAGFRVALGDARPLAAHPESTTDTITELACPEAEALVGLRIAQQHYPLADGSVAAVTTRLWLTCAELVLVDDGEQLGIAWQGAKETAPVSGSHADGTAWFAESRAPSGTIASRLLGTSGSWVDRIGFGVSRWNVVRR